MKLNKCTRVNDVVVLTSSDGYGWGVGGCYKGGGKGGNHDRDLQHFAPYLSGVVNTSKYTAHTTKF